MNTSRMTRQPTQPTSHERGRLTCPQSGQLLAERQSHLRVRLFFFELGIEQTRLDIFVVLVLAAGVLGDVALDRVVEDLADGHSRVNSNRLNRENLQSPVSAESDVAEASRAVHEEPHSAD